MCNRYLQMCNFYTRWKPFREGKQGYNIESITMGKEVFTVLTLGTTHVCFFQKIMDFGKVIVSNSIWYRLGFRQFSK